MTGQISACSVMGSSTSKSLQKDTTVLPCLGNGKYDVGCAEIMIKSNDNDDDIGILLTVYYPSDSVLTSDVRNSLTQQYRTFFIS